MAVMINFHILQNTFLKIIAPSKRRDGIVEGILASRTSSGPFLRRYSSLSETRCHSQTQELTTSSQKSGRWKDLTGFIQRVQECNTGLDQKKAFLPFKIQEATVGYIHHSFAEKLCSFPDVFVLEEDLKHEGDNGIYIPDIRDSRQSISLCSDLASPEERSFALDHVNKALENQGLIPGWRDELYPVVEGFNEPPLALIERAAAPLYGIKAYGVHVNGYVIKANGSKHLWVARRSRNKQTYPGLLDHLVAGGQPHGLSCSLNVVKECGEEASVPTELAQRSLAVGAVSYEVIKNTSYKRDVLFCYDLLLPQDFVPENSDGEVESFELLPLNDVATIISSTKNYKPNCTLVIIDFLFRHGFLDPDQKGYLPLLKSLRGGDCS